jgi:hypothetical protein
MAAIGTEKPQGFPHATSVPPESAVPESAVPPESRLATVADGNPPAPRDAVVAWPPVPGPLSRDQCFQLIAEAAYGRVVYTESALPAVSLVTFVLDGEVLRFDIDADSALAEASRAGVLAFEADSVDARDGLGWTVTVTGHAKHVATHPLRPAADAPAAGKVTVKLLPELVVGWRTYVVPAPRRADR